MHDVLHAKWSEMGVWTSKYLKRERNKALFSSKSSNDYDFRVSERLLTLENVCSTFCVRSKVKRAFKRWNILNGREITHNSRQNRRVITILEFLGVSWRWKTYALHSACEMERKRRLNVWNILNGREIKHNYLQNRRVITILEFLGVLWRRKTFALRSACEMEWKGHLNVEISQTGGK